MATVPSFSPLRCNQNLGVFESELLAIYGAVNHLSPPDRTVLDRYTVLDGDNDPKFPSSGSFKAVFFCFSRIESEFLVHVALRNNRGCPAFYREKRAFNTLAGIAGVVKPALIQTAGKFEWMISELFNQGDLISFLEDGSQIETLATHQIAYSIVCILQQCHMRGVILRDLKLENVLVDEFMADRLQVGLIDFGLVFDRGKDTTMDSVAPRGSPLYTSPEDWVEIHRCKSTLPASPERDIWALGLILFALATGDLPADELKENDKIIGVMVFEDDGSDLGLFGDIIRSIIYKEREDRPCLDLIERQMRLRLLDVYPDLPEVQALRAKCAFDPKIPGLCERIMEFIFKRII